MLLRITSPIRVDLELKRILLACLEDANSQLKYDSIVPHKGIHETRKRFKEIRAILLLLGPDYRSEKVLFTEKARSLADLRDAKATLESCNKLEQYFIGRLSFNPFPDLHQHLEVRLAQVEASYPMLEGELRQLREVLHRAQDRVKSWPIKDKGFDLLRKGLQESYRAGRNTYRECQSNMTGADYHGWRKHVKSHWYHISLLKNSWPYELNGRERALKSLANTLGDDHDLLVLEQLVFAEPQQFGKPKQFKELLSLIHHRRQELQGQALLMGARLYAEKPVAHITRLKAYWTAWQVQEQMKYTSDLRMKKL
ncbi:MAG TPA: hypothetical protein DCZ03_04860 [Gammaproteobacteria bacterium]|nr:hypothetical protein [Gammaproteobacteria bacterium]